MPSPTTIAKYIDAAPPESRKTLRELYAILKKVAPEAKEGLKWGSPVLEEKRILFAFSAHRSHVNFMPTRSALEPFKRDLADFKTGKDTIQLPNGQPLPAALIRKIARYRAKEVREEDSRWMHAPRKPRTGPKGVARSNTRVVRAQGRRRTVD